MRYLLDYLESHRSALTWISFLSAGMFVVSLALVPWLVARAPSDYFVRAPSEHRRGASLIKKALLNLLGAVMLIAGLLMLVLPGQGLLMVLLALSLLDVPGKRTLIQRIVQRPTVWRALSYLRERAHKDPFQRPTVH